MATRDILLTLVERSYVSEIVTVGILPPILTPTALSLCSPTSTATRSYNNDFLHIYHLPNGTHGESIRFFIDIRGTVMYRNIHWCIKMFGESKDTGYQFKTDWKAVFEHDFCNICKNRKVCPYNWECHDMIKFIKNNEGFYADMDDDDTDNGSE